MAIELLSTAEVAAELKCTPRQARNHMKRMGLVEIGHGLVTRESLEQYKCDRASVTEYNYRELNALPPINKTMNRRAAPAKAGTAAQRYPRIRKEA